MFLLSRLVAEDESIWAVIDRRLNELLPYALGVTHEIYAAYGDKHPFDVDQKEFIDYVIKQFSLRAERIEQARGKSLAEIYRIAVADAEEPGEAGPSAEPGEARQSAGPGEAGESGASGEGGTAA